MAPDIDFSKIRAEGGDRREGFEEFSAQIFHRLVVPATAEYERYRGAGGDGGVEAIWRLSSGDVIGLQSKFFLPLKAAHIGQLEKSLDTALDNFPTLKTYVVTLPFDPTPTVQARKGAGEVEKLESWREALVSRAAKRGTKISVEWWFASDLKSRLLGMDNPSGRIQYWFGAVHLTRATLEKAASVAEAIAGARYSPNLRVGTGAGDTLRAFALDPRWTAVEEGWGAKLREVVRIWADFKPADHLKAADQILQTVSDALRRFEALETLTFSEADRLALRTLGAQTLPVAQDLEAKFKAAFDDKHGANCDTQGWRQYQAAYQVHFPAADLDRARDACKLLTEIIAFAETEGAKAAGASVLLMRGPAGIGKTHTAIDATKERVAFGCAALTVLGQEITTGLDLWNVVGKKLGISPTATNGEVVGVMAAHAEATNAPFLLMVDAVNETPDRARWQAWLPQLIADLAGQPIKLLLTCRDIFVEDALGAPGTALVSFSHAGFAGREYDAAYAFATFYKVGPPAEVVAQPEFANPLFLHLVCRAAVSQKWTRIPGGQVSLTTLVTAILEGANDEAAKLLDHDARIENPVREGALALAEAMGQQGVRHLAIAAAHKILDAIRPSKEASRSLLRAMEQADLISVGLEDSGHVVRFGFERLGDLLIAQASVEGRTLAEVQSRFGSGDLAALVADAHAVSANAGLIQAYSILLPEKFGVEIADLLQASAVNSEITRLALGVLVWRDLQSFKSEAWVLRHQTFADLVELLGQVLAVAAVPGHALNATWLDTFLRRITPPDRDALWTVTLKGAWSEAGAGHQLSRIAREQNLSHMSAASAALLAKALSWFTASADLLIRDESTQALTRLMAAQPVAKATVDDFVSCDDDYIRERVLTAAYGAGLLRRDPAYWGDVAEVTFKGLFASGAPPENVLLRDLGRQIVEEASAAGTLPSGATLAATRPPYSSSWPLRLTFPSWAAIESSYGHFANNLKLGQKMEPDFAIYCVKPRVEGFDLATAGLTIAQCNQWIVEQIIALGYTDQGQSALVYDHNLIVEHGDGRSVPSRHRRVSKKYEWIFLARLLGHLYDHVPRRPRSWGVPETPTDLQGVELRVIDPTDLPNASPAPIAGVEFANFFEPIRLASPPMNAKDWMVDLFATNQTNLIAGEWVMLAGWDSWRHEDKSDEMSRSVSRTVRSMVVSNTRLTKLRAAFAESVPREDLPELRRLFRGEYADSVALLSHPREWEIGHWDFGRPASAIVKGFETPETAVHDLWVPAPELIASSAGTWDGAKRWTDTSGKPVAAQIGERDNTILIFDRTALAGILAAAKSTLVWIAYEERIATAGWTPLGFTERYQAWSWKGSRLTKVAEDTDSRWADDEDDADDHLSGP